MALLCSEEDPTECHRRRLIGRVLDQKDVEVLHIRGDGSVQSQREMDAAEERHSRKGQLMLFDLQEPSAWKSTQSVTQRKRHESSSRVSTARGSED